MTTLQKPKAAKFPMNQSLITLPVLFDQVNKKGLESGFDMASDTKAGSLLRTLVASKPHGRFLELGTGILVLHSVGCWPEGHAEKAEKLTQQLAGHTDLIVSMIQWSTGIILATKAG